MKITYDKEADAMYIEFSSEKFVSNKKIDGQTIIDLDKDQKIIGIELLNASKRIPKGSLAQVSLETVG